MVDRLFLFISYKLDRGFKKSFEDGPRESIVLPSDLGMPLHTEHEPARTRIDDGFDHSVQRPGDHSQITSEVLDRLMMAAVDPGRSPPRQLGQPRIRTDLNMMRWTIV